MPQFQRQPIAAAQPRRNYFKEMLDKQEKKVDKDRLAEALSVIAGRPLDRSNETWIQKSLRGNRKVISTQQDAMDVIRDLQPSIWSDIKTRQAKLTENETKRTEALQEKQIEALEGAQPEFAEMARQGRELPIEERKSFFDRAGPAILQKHDQLGNLGLAGLWDEVTEEEIQDSFLDEKIQVLGVTSPTKEAGTEFERLLATVDLDEEQKSGLRKQRLAKFASADPNTLVIAFDENGNPIVSMGGADELTKVQAGKAKAAFIDKRIESRKFHSLGKRVLKNAREQPAQLGVTGWAGRTIGDVKAIARNLGLSSELEEISMDFDDYNFGSLAASSAAYKTNALTLGVMWALATGIGKGRMSDKDVQHGITAVGGGTQDIEQLEARLTQVFRTLDEDLRIESEERGYGEYKSILGATSSRQSGIEDILRKYQ